MAEDVTSALTLRNKTHQTLQKGCESNNISLYCELRKESKRRDFLLNKTTSVPSAESTVSSLSMKELTSKSNHKITLE